MNTDTGSVFSQALARASKNKVLVGVGATALGAATFFSVGFMRQPTPVADPIVSTAPPVASNTIAPLLALNRATEAAAARVTPSVVNIAVVGKETSNSGSGGGAAQQMNPQNIPAPFQQFFGQGGPFQFRMQPQSPQSQEFQALGTGLIISPNGYIVTNNHVVAGATSVTVTLHDKRTFKAKVVGTDKPTDLAVIKIDATGLQSAAWGDSSKLVPGETVLAIGDPLGMDFSVTRGIVSAVNRPRLGDGPDARGVFIQTDAPINHGNSGGPLVDAYGDVIGINAEMLTESGASDGIGFAIPSNLVKRTAAELIEHGKVTRGYLGLEVTDLIPSVADSLNESGTEGALVNQVEPGSPAAMAGVKPYDVITGFNGRKVTSGTDLQTDAGETAPGAKAELHIMRDGKAISLPVTLGDLSKANSGGGATASASNGSTPKLGIEAEGVTPQVRQQYQIPDNVNGVLVTSVDPGSPAMVAGVNSGDVIEQANRQPVNTVAQLEAQLRATPAGKSVLLMVHNNSGNFIIPVTPNQ